MDQDIARLRRMIEEIRPIRERTSGPKSNQNPRYHALSSALPRTLVRGELARQGSQGHVRTSLGHYRCRVRVTIDVIKLTTQNPNRRMR